MKSIDKFVLVLVASLALLLAGCGGGSSSTAPDPEPTAGETAIMNAKQALSTAQAAVGSATTDQGRLAAQQGVVQAASNLIDVLTANGGSAADIKAASDALANARIAITSLMSAIEGANMDMKAMAMKLFNGLKQGAAPDTDPTAAQTANGALEAGRFISLSSTAVTVDTDATDGDSVSVKKTSTAVPSLGGWAGSDYVRKMSGTTDHVVLYNNRGMKSVALSEKHSAIITAGTGDDLGTYTIADSALTTAANQPYIKADDFSTSGTKPHTEDDGDEITINGTFDGVAGMYTCEQAGATACTSMVDGSGNIVLAGGWTFGQFNLSAMTQTMDTAYLVYGWWSRETSAGVDVKAIVGDDPDGAGTNTAVVSGNAAANSINGTATYKGGAAGKYAVYNPLGDNSSAGAFTANATLTANFTTKKISGELTDFMSGGESMDWTVSLDAGDAANIDGSGIGNTDGGTADNVSTTWTMGGTADDPRGSWSGNFYKSNDATTTTEPDTQTPAAVTGIFNSEYWVGGLQIGEMAGAFGTELED